MGKKYPLVCAVHKHYNVCMKIEGANKSSNAKGVSKAGIRKTGDGAFGAMVSEAGEAESSSPASRTASVGALDALLSLQEVGGDGRRKGQKRAADLLDQLDKIRNGLLLGTLSRATLERLGSLVSQHREDNVDPKLAEILDEIELRAAVELAKFDIT